MNLLDLKGSAMFSLNNYYWKTFAWFCFKHNTVGKSDCINKEQDHNCLSSLCASLVCVGSELFLFLRECESVMVLWLSG